MSFATFGRSYVLPDITICDIMKTVIFLKDGNTFKFNPLIKEHIFTLSSKYISFHCDRKRINKNLIFERAATL
jgi:hypothetical protein